MAQVVGLEDVRAGERRQALEGGAIVRTDFMGSTEPRAPQAFMVKYDPNRVSRPHFHSVDQFQIVIDGRGSIGRHEIAPYSVHFARAYTPYGPLVGSDAGMTFVTLRRRYDPGARRFPEAKAELEQVADRDPWQVTCAAPLDSRSAQAVPESGVLVQAIPDIKDDRGLATFSLAMEPNASAFAPDPSRGEGQFILVLEGSLVHGGREHKAITVVSVDPNESAFQIKAGAQGLKGLILAFPSAEAKQAVAAEASEGGLKTWHCVLCAFVYDEAAGLPEEGIAPGTRWEDVPATWSCPDCAASKSEFQMIEL